MKNLVGERLRAKYGSLVDSVAYKSWFYAFRQQARRKTLSPALLNYWITRFIRSRFESMKPSSLTATDTMLHGRFVKQMEEDHERVSEAYRELFNYHLNKD